MQMAIKYLISNRYFAKKSLLFFSFIFENVLFFQNKLTALTSIFESDSRTWKNQVRVLLDKTNKNKEEENVKESNGIFFSSKIMLLFFPFFFLFSDLELCNKEGKIINFKLNYPRTDARFFFGLCPVAGLPEKNASLKACSGCSSVCYANRDAQKAHWKQHKSMCKALQPLGKFHLHL